MAKYLGVHLHEKLQWKPHVSAIVKKANNTRAFLQRNLKGCPEPVKNRCYTTYVRPTLEYAASVWDPTGLGNKTLREKLESTQNKCARFVTGDWRRTSSVSAMVASLGWLSLHERRARIRVAMLHRIVHDLVDIDKVKHLTIAQHQYNTRGAHLKFLVPRTRLNVYENSFFPSSINMWNQISAGLTAAGDPEVFRAGLGAVQLTN